MSVIIHTFGSNKVDREYGENDLKRLVPAEVFGLEPGFYGGRCTHVGVTNTDVLLIWDNTKDPGERLIDTGAVNMENIPPRFIKQLLDKRKIPYDKTGKREDLIAKLEGR